MLDVRTPLEFDEVHVPQAHNVPLDKFDPNSLLGGGLLIKDQPAYLLCRSGGRASKAAEKLAKDGLDKSDSPGAIPFDSLVSAADNRSRIPDVGKTPKDRASHPQTFAFA